jgi:hypothetical protein
MYAQDISVTNFYMDEKDLTANGRNAEVDQNGDKCALIRVQTTMKGFVFDVGSAGVQKVDDNHTGEIWVWVPYGVRHISIRHTQLGSLPNYDFPINIQKAKTYIMEITSAKVYVNNYDDTHKQILSIKVTPVKSQVTLNGMKLQLDGNGMVEQELSFGTYTYKVESDGYYPKEGQVEINNLKEKQALVINDLRPITGKLSVHTDPRSATVLIDGKITNETSLTPKELQIGKHDVRVIANGYKEERQTVDIEENKTLDISIALTQTATFSVSSKPNGASVSINKEKKGVTPFSTVLTTGKYVIKATKKGYKDFEKNVDISSSTPELKILLKKIFNYKNEVYAQVDGRFGSFTAIGATLGGYIHSVNVEVSYLSGSAESGQIYWNGENIVPKSATYKPSTNICGKIGYGVSLGTRFRITPQVGANLMKLKENMSNGAYVNPADGANALSALASIRFSAAIVNHLAISLSPEYSFVMSKSKGYELLSETSSDIKGWCDGFNIKVGLAIFF